MKRPRQGPCPDLMPMIITLVMDERGRPLCCEMWPGKTTDVTALMPVIDRLGWPRPNRRLSHRRCYR